MRLIKTIKNRIVSWQYSRISKHLQKANPAQLVTTGDRKLLEAFRRAAEHVPAYGNFLAKQGVDIAAIRSVEHFLESVPFVDKQSVFSDNALKDICIGGELEDIALFYSSSGSSGVFSFGAETWENIPKMALMLEFLLDDAFDIFRKKTLLINCLPMGVSVYTRTLPLAQTSVRSDVVIALIRKLYRDFDQFILVGESPFLKKVVEDGVAEGIDWKNIVVHVITGAEFIAENYRSYLGHLLGIDFDRPEKGMIGVNMGLSELSLSIFNEKYQTLQIRRAAREDPRLKEALFPDDDAVLPLVMQYFPMATYIETVPGEEGRPEIVVSILDPDAKIPLIRYKTGDMGRIMDYETYASILNDLGYAQWTPPFRLPIGIIYGKRQRLILDNGNAVSPDAVKEALYENFDIAGMITGNFKLLKDGNKVRLLIQLKKESQTETDTSEKLTVILKKYSSVDIQPEFFSYRRFPYGLEHDYERKNRYV